MFGIKTFKRETKRDKIYLIFVVALLLIMGFITLYPFYYVVCVSFSNPIEFAKRGVSFLPAGFSIASYQAVFESHGIWRAVKNSIVITAIGSAMSLFLTSMAGYVFSRKRLVFREFWVILTIIPMYISGGTIPTYILINKLGLYNSIWAIIVPGLTSTYYLVLARSYYDTLPVELEESAWLDGANDIYIYFRIMMPLAKPILAVLFLYFAVGLWNVYLPAVMYLTKSSQMPIQVFLSDVVLGNAALDSAGKSAQNSQDKALISQQLKYALVIVGILPIMCIYPFVQKYIVKGMMLGSLKG